MSSLRFKCSSPLRVEWAALQSSIWVRCKRCEGCRLLRQYQWIARAAHEQAFAKRTWFITLTFRPVERARIMQRASARARAKTPGQRLVAESGVSVTKFIKRLRKPGFAFRYLWVPELHSNGFPHWHGLIHDLRGDMLWKDIASQWRDGFSVVKLVRDAKALRYVTKYLSKENSGSPRASLGYGESEADRQETLALREAASSTLGEPFDVHVFNVDGKGFKKSNVTMKNEIDLFDLGSTACE